MIRFLLLCLFLLTGNSLVHAQSELLWQSLIEETNSFASPKCADLNGDNVLDIVMGGGQEFDSSDFGVMAFDGVDGSLLWTVTAERQVYSNPLFMDITEDGRPDVFVGGREGVFMAIDGLAGIPIWSFAIAPEDTSWLNFYSPQFIPDQDGDAYPDLLCANGGYIYADADDTLRPPGHLTVLSSFTGEVLARAPMPDGRETYQSPVVHDFDEDGILEIVFGSGGETIGGSLWLTNLEDLMNNDISNALALHSSVSNGYIAPASLVDLNMDGRLDIVAGNYDGSLVAVNGVDYTSLWEIYVDNSELTTNPCIGQFTEDEVPDVFVSFAIGVWPEYNEYIRMAIDGSTGAILMTDTLQNFEFYSFIACDLTADGKDEVLFLDQSIGENTVSHQLRAYDLMDSSIMDLGSVSEGYNMTSTPWIGDLDSDSMLDLVYAFSTETIPYSTTLLNVSRVDLDVEVPPHISWSSYLGTTGTGVYQQPQTPFPVGVHNAPEKPSVYTHFETDTQVLNVSFDEKPAPDTRLEIYDLQGRQLLDLALEDQATVVDLRHLSKGLFFSRLVREGEVLLVFSF